MKYIQNHNINRSNYDFMNIFRLDSGKMFNEDIFPETQRTILMGRMVQPLPVHDAS